jgi:hypothetical protein
MKLLAHQPLAAASQVRKQLASNAHLMTVDVKASGVATRVSSVMQSEAVRSANPLQRAMNDLFNTTAFDSTRAASGSRIIHSEVPVNTGNRFALSSNGEIVDLGLGPITDARDGATALAAAESWARGHGKSLALIQAGDEVIASRVTFSHHFPVADKNGVRAEHSQFIKGSTGQPYADHLTGTGAFGGILARPQHGRLDLRHTPTNPDAFDSGVWVRMLPPDDAKALKAAKGENSHWGEAEITRRLPAAGTYDISYQAEFPGLSALVGPDGTLVF